MIKQAHINTAERLARMVPHVLEQRGLEPCFTDWVLTHTESDQTWLFGALDVRAITRLERYTDPKLLHQVSTACRGIPVYLSNSNGLRYGFLLSGRPHLPKRVDFPGCERGMARLGVGLQGEVYEPWDRLGHLLVAGMTGSGKSVFLRLLAHQGIVDGARLILADLDGTTFSMLAGHTALLAPIAANPSEAHQVVGLALGECDRRAALYMACGGYPDSVSEYNTLAVKAGEPPLARVLVVLDEFNATVTAIGGARGQFANDVASLTWRGRKFGVNVIAAAQDFAIKVVGRMRDQLSPVLFRVQSKELARAVECSGAWKITQPGRALSARWGAFQVYWLDKTELATATAGAGILSESELALVLWAIEENDGYLSLADIQTRARARETQWQARKLAADWELRGWLAKDTTMGNKRQITTNLAQIAQKLRKPQTPQSPQSPPANRNPLPQTDLGLLDDVPNCLPDDWGQ